MVESDQMEEPILVRLFFEVPPERIAEFEVVYRDQLLPVLQKRDLTESLERGRATPDNIFSRLFEFKRPFNAFEQSILDAYEDDKRRILARDPSIAEGLRYAFTL